MEKSKLRNIIKESIKELMTEQVNVPGTRASLHKCTGYPPGSYGNFCIPNQYNPAIGQGWTIDQYHATSGQWVPGFNFFITDVYPSQPCNAVINGVETLLSPYTSLGNGFGNQNPGQGCWWCCTQSSWNLGGTPSGDCWNACPGSSNYYGWNCEQIGDHPKFGSKCVPGNQNNPGTFQTMQDCMESGCEGLSPDKSKDIQQPFSPLTTDPQDMVKPEDDEMRRMKELAKISKK